MSLLWLQPMSTIVTGGRDGALACESCVSFVTFLALSSSLKFVVLFTLLTIRGFGTSLFSCLHPPANTMSLSLYRMYAVCAECHRGSLQVLCTWWCSDHRDYRRIAGIRAPLQRIVPHKQKHKLYTSTAHDHSHCSCKEHRLQAVDPANRFLKLCTWWEIRFAC